MSFELYPCELHCHTLHSDGDFTVKELISEAKKRQLKGICLTDHNTVSGHKEAFDSDLVILKGIEWTTYFGHMLCLDSNSYVDWRNAVPDNIDEKTDEVKQADGLCGVAHPFQWGTPICTGGHWDFKVSKWENFSYIEVFSEGEPYLNDKNALAIEFWHSLLDKGYKIAPTMGRDWHRLKGNKNISACTYLYCEGELTESKMKQALKEGRTVVTTGAKLHFTVDGNFIVGDTLKAGEHTFTFNIDTSRQKQVDPEESFNFKELRLISKGGECVKTVCAKEGTFKAELLKDRWYSLELWGDSGKKENTLLALTGAVYCK